MFSRVKSLLALLVFVDVISPARMLESVPLVPGLVAPLNALPFARRVLLARSLSQ